MLLIPEVVISIVVVVLVVVVSVICRDRVAVGGDGCDVGVYKWCGSLFHTSPNDSAGRLYVWGASAHSGTDNRMSVVAIPKSWLDCV